MWNHLAELFAGVGVAHAMAPPSGGGEGQSSFLLQMAPFFMIFAIIYFVMIRPQQKRQQDTRQMQESLKAGDQVLVNGIYGEVARVKDDVITLKVDDNVRIRIQRSFVTTKISIDDKAQAASEEKQEKSKKDS